MSLSQLFIRVGVDIMSEVTQKEKYLTIIEWWYEGWLDVPDISILADELIRLHTTKDIPLYEYSDAQVNEEYEDIMQTKKDLGYE
jgi:hypothetical protein|tara:strand:- start:5829 stop:6083 length:255 start_codon:yes stop_codon:yes gene_type:complete